MRTRRTLPANNGLGIHVQFNGEIEVQEELADDENEGGDAEGGNDIFHNLLHNVMGWIINHVADNNQRPQAALEPERDFEEEFEQQQDEAQAEAEGERGAGDDDDEWVDEPEEDDAFNVEIQNGGVQMGGAGRNGGAQAGGVVPNGRAPRAQRGPAPPPEDTNWVISHRRLSLTVGNALLLPFFSNFVGLGLAQLPFIQGMVPDTFQRNVLGGILVIGIKDIVNVATSYLRLRKERSMRVVSIEDILAIQSGRAPKNYP